MKPKEYIKKYNLTQGWKSQYQNGFLADLTSELLSYIEVMDAFDKPQKFDNALDVIRTKWDAISNKVPYGLPDKLWNYFYATTVIKIRKETLPTETARIERERAERKAEREAERKRKAEWEAQWRAEREHCQQQWEKARNAWFKLLFGALSECPIDSFQLLGLSSNASKDQVQARYRELVIKYHPDRGGSQEQFVMITEAKNKCLAWIK